MSAVPARRDTVAAITRDRPVAVSFTGVRCATCGTGWHPRRAEHLLSAGARCPRCRSPLGR